MLPTAPSDIDARARTVALAHRLRIFLEPRWFAHKITRALYRPHAEALSASMCRLTAAALVDVLEAEIPAGWRVAGGSGDPYERSTGQTTLAFPGGYRAANGHWCGHYWAVSDRLGLIVDLTADQFGDAPVVVAAGGDPRYRGCYTARALRAHLRTVRASRQRWVREWREQAAAVPPPSSTFRLDGTLILRAPVAADAAALTPPGWTLATDCAAEGGRVLVMALRSHPVAAATADEALWSLASGLAPLRGEPARPPTAGDAYPAWRVDTAAGPCDIDMLLLSPAAPADSARRRSR